MSVFLWPEWECDIGVPFATLLLCHWSAELVRAGHVREAGVTLAAPGLMDNKTCMNKENQGVGDPEVRVWLWEQAIRFKPQL